MGDFAYKLVELIGKHALPSFSFAKAPRRMHSRREVRLDSLNCRLGGTAIGARRIDILVHTDEHIFIIENKVHSAESAEQTQDYFRAISDGLGKNHQIVYLLLSPDGRSAQCRHFSPISYIDLFGLILEAKKHGKELEPVAELLYSFLLKRA